ncbi:MAG TPA: hypothetical protein VE817_01020, partial [Candidatus Acidoferrum sp.]|nr:hypothetical protein [Candidatus Acidoferrum sp.]
MRRIAAATLLVVPLLAGSAAASTSAGSTSAGITSAGIIATRTSGTPTMVATRAHDTVVTAAASRPLGVSPLAADAYVPGHVAIRVTRWVGGFSHPLFLTFGNDGSNRW